MNRLAMWVGFVVAVAGAAGCDLDPFHLELGPGVPDAGTPLPDAAPRPDAIADASGGEPPDAAGVDVLGCVPQPESCNGEDDDCDMVIDNGFNLATDPMNCGSCGTKCDQAAANQNAQCINRSCAYSCRQGFVDCQANMAGCETQCLPTNGGVEACDGIDNDCDCVIDEGFNVENDPANCGACGRACVVLHATATCTNRVCGFANCETGFADIDDAIPGCEYQCPVFPPRASDTTCDGVDDDCDGEVDEDFAMAGTPCDTGDLGECQPGKIQCLNRAPVCVPNKAAQPEICDQLDNDCDGLADNGFDKPNDPQHCGVNCTVCNLPNAIQGCQNGQCKYVACAFGYVDLFPDDQFPNMPGCDYQCTPTGPEVCDGVDNDCDGKIDGNDPSMLPVANFCATKGVCAGTQPTCVAGPAGCADRSVGWRCVYPGSVEKDSCGDLLPNEMLCDNNDGNCDGNVDDGFALKNQPCDDGKLGACRSSGKYDCVAGMPTSQTLTCKFDVVGVASKPEVCNNVDDDCDGMIDDGATDQMTRVDNGSLPPFFIYKYEASRPDATATSVGSVERRSCSNANVLPWTLVTWTQANAACTAAGKRLCSEAEWEAACSGEMDRLYPYGNTYQPRACNGKDYDPDCTGAEDDVMQATGKAHGCPKPATSLCVSPWDGEFVYDMSGNLREWTSFSPGTGLRRIRGGAFDNIGAALTCEFDFWAEEESAFYFNLGFRCCSNTAN